MTKKPHSTAYKIFNYPFRCYVQNMYIQSELVTEEFGSFSTGNQSQDIKNANELIEVTITINDMAEIHRTDGTFQLSNPRDSIRIYDLIVEHLQGWVDKSRTQINGPKAPIDDLILLDSLAAAVYKSAKVYMASEVKTPTLLAKLQGISPFTNKTPKKNTVPDKHNPLTNMINVDVINSRNKSWR